MKLYEFEGHDILTRVGIDSPFFVVCEDLEEVEQARKRIDLPLVAKVQVLSGRRGKNGGVKVINSDKELRTFCKSMFGKKFSGEKVKFISLSEKINIRKELYASITYDTLHKQPVLIFGRSGGVDIEDKPIIKHVINPLVGYQKSLISVGVDKELSDFLARLWDAFVRFDCRLVEVNPIAKTKNGYIAVDSKIILDDNGLVRQKEIDVLPKGSAGAIPTERELQARKIDAEDYRGSAGSTFIEFPGDIAILASGGGASLLVVDAVVAAGGKPANYTEYSGNPPAEKVEKLAKIALSKENLSGCLVAGAVANFTDIYETLSGFAKGLVEVSPKAKYPIVVRRGGPRTKEAYKMLSVFAKKNGFDIHLFGPETPISVACKEIVDLSNKYKKNGNTRK